jgi:hypothetical protein
LRDYQAHAQPLEQAGGLLAVLTNDSPEILREVMAEQGFTHRFVHVTPETWAGWGLQNDKQAQLPYPTTFVVAPDGTLVFREIHVNHTRRAHVEEVVARVAAWAQDPAVAAPPDDHEQRPDEDDAYPDWDNAVRIAAEQLPGQLVVHIEVGPGFHVYGANETLSRPLAASVDQLPELVVPIPTGAEKDLGEALGTAWVLEGSVALEVALPADAPVTLSGVLDYQVCTDSACTAPTSTTWRSGLADER